VQSAAIEPFTDGFPQCLKQYEARGRYPGLRNPSLKNRAAAQLVTWQMWQTRKPSWSTTCCRFAEGNCT